MAAKRKNKTAAVSLPRNSELIDAIEVPKGLTPIQRTRWVAERLLDATWSPKLYARCAEAWGVSESSVRHSAQAASHAVQMTGTNLQAIAAKARYRLDVIAETAENVRDKISANEILLRSTGAMKTFQVGDDGAVAPDQKASTIQQLQHPHPTLADCMREAFSNPGPVTEQILRECKQVVTTTGRAKK